MSDLVWWTLFFVLSILLIVFTVKLCSRIIKDVYCKQPDINSKEVEEDEDEEIGLPQRYHVDARSFISYAPPLVNSEYERIRQIEENVQRQEEEMNKEEEMYIILSKTPLQSNQNAVISNEVSDEENSQQEAATSSKDVEEEDSDSFTNEEKEILQKIEEINNKVEKDAQQMPYFVSGNQLQYYDINQNLLLNAIELSNVDCNKNEKLRRRKHIVSMYIHECQNKLKQIAEQNSVVVEINSPKNDTHQTNADIHKEQDVTEDDEEKILDTISGIKGEVEIYARQIPNCIGGKQQLQYYDINQNLLLSSMRLSEINCKKNDRLAKRKQMVSLYIQQCQEQLNKKADEECF